MVTVVVALCAVGILAVVFALVYWARQEAEIQRLEEEIKAYDFKEDTEADYT